MLGHGMAVDVVDHGAQQGVAGQHEQGGKAGLGQQARARAGAHGGRAP
ncbi:hypothetical protein SDC9_182905 [bioreactor metagenome]|uniref:Uncharacterized protein n=1 Tax=bioreactor metagenome TaxID=1076179 RepID=A0A645H8P3_9ZZZZ